MSAFNRQPLMKAGGNIAPSVFVKPSTAADNTALQASSGDRVIGISQEGQKNAPGISGSDTTIAAASGDMIQIFGLGDVCLLTLGSGGCAADDLLVPDASGQGITAAATGTAVIWVGAVAFEAGVAGQKVRVQIMVLPVTWT